MKINKYNPPEALKNSVMSKITDDGYADELLALPETSKKKTHVIPLISAAAAVTIVVCASVYVIGLGGVKKSDELIDEESAVDGNDDVFDEYSDMIRGDGSTGTSTDSYTEDMPEVDEDYVISGSVSNDNGFLPDDNGSSKGNSVAVTVTVNKKTYTLSHDDSEKIMQLIDIGEGMEYDCTGCTIRYTIRIGTTDYTVHNECQNVQSGHGIYRNVPIAELDKIINNYVLG